MNKKETYPRRNTMRQRILFALFIALAAILLTSCTSSEALDMIDQLRVEQDQKLEGLSSQVTTNDENIRAIKTQITSLQQEISGLETSLSGLQKEFEFTYNTINEFVTYAGYESSEDFLSLGRDIVGVTRRIDEFNARIDGLQELMRDFLTK